MSGNGARAERGLDFFVFLPTDEMARRFAAPPADEEEPEKPSLAERMGVSPEDLNDAIELLPDIERDVLYEYFVLKRRQQDIATVHGVTQAAISYSMGRALERLRIHLSMPKMTEAELRDELEIGIGEQRAGRNPRARVIEMMVELWATSSQSHTSKKLGVAQGALRHIVVRETRGLRAKAAKDPRCQRAATWFWRLVHERLWNFRRRIILPQWTAEGRSRVRAQ